MTLIDIIEMVADWMASAQRKNESINLKYLSGRFGIDKQLIEIIANTLAEEDIWNIANNVPVTQFCPNEMMENRCIEGFEHINSKDLS